MNEYVFLLDEVNCVEIELSLSRIDELWKCEK